ncbi:MAG: hypothetical protein V2A74_06390 [bacterium]
MKVRRFFPALALMVWVAAMIPAFGQTENPMAWVPTDSEFIISVNVRSVADSSLFQRILREKGGEKAQAVLQILHNLTGVDPLKDLDRVCIWGRIDDNDSVAVLFQGRFNQESLLTLLKVNPMYKVADRDGVQTHEWFDQKEKRMKYGQFLSDGSALIVNQLQTLDAAHQSRTGGKGLVATPKAGMLPAQQERLSAWVALFKPERELANGKMKDTLQAQSAWASLLLDASGLAVRVNVQTVSDKAAQGWRDIAQGGLALLRLQQDNKVLARLAGPENTSLNSKDRSTTLELKLSEEEVMEIIGSPKGAESKKP